MLWLEPWTSLSWDWLSLDRMNVSCNVLDPRYGGINYTAQCCALNADFRCHTVCIELLCLLRTWTFPANASPKQLVVSEKWLICTCEPSDILTSCWQKAPASLGTRSWVDTDGSISSLMASHLYTLIWARVVCCTRQAHMLDRPPSQSHITV